MNRDEFLKQLQKRLQTLPEPEQQEIIEEYDAHIREGLKAGRDEADLIAALGDPHTIAKLFLADRAVRQAAVTGSILASLRAVFVVVSLGLLNIVLIAGPLALAVLLACTGWILSLTLGATGTFLFVAAFILTLLPGWFALGGTSLWTAAAISICFGIAFISFSGLLGLVMWRFSKWLAQAIIQYLKTHLSSIPQGGTHEHS